MNNVETIYILASGSVIIALVLWIILLHLELKLTKLELLRGAR